MGTAHPLGLEGVVRGLSPPRGGGGGATTTGLDATSPPAICQNLRGQLGRGGGSAGGWGGGGVLAAWPGGGGRGCAQPTTIACIPQGGVWGHGGIEVCMR